MNTKFKIIGLTILTFIVSCDLGSQSWNNKIVTIKNNSSSTIACVLLDSDVMTDSLIYKDTTYRGYLIRSQHYDTYMQADSNLINSPNSAKTYIYIFNIDSLNKFNQSRFSAGILKHSLLRKIVVQLNKVHEPIDTVYAK